MSPVEASADALISFVRMCDSDAIAICRSCFALADGLESDIEHADCDECGSANVFGTVYLVADEDWETISSAMKRDRQGDCL